MASMKRMSPPVGVQARPVATPGTLVRSLSSFSYLRAPRILPTSARRRLTLRFAPLAIRVAEKLVEQQERGGLYHGHRDYCGHGFIYRDGQFILAEVRDGYPEESPHLATWDSQDAFVSFLANLSDYICSGADAEHELFYTDDSFSLNNQRIKRAWMEKYVGNE